MKLDRVEIKNFRSIQDTTLDFDPPCRVLVGINESGKSNILTALALLGSSRKPSRKDDLREASPDEDPIDKSYVRFIFKLEKDESDLLFETVSSSILANTKNPDIVSIGNKHMGTKEFCANRNEGIYLVNILDETKGPASWKLDKGYELLAGWKKPTKACPKEFVIESKGQQYKPAQFKLIRPIDFETIPEGYLEDATIDDLDSFSSLTIRNLVKERLPALLFWEYDEEDLLPNSVNIDLFSSEPDSCIPLKNMFSLAGIDDIKASISKAKELSPLQFQNYLDRVAKKTTNHFRAVWKEYKNIQFSLRLNADDIIPGIKEINTLEFARRSDGFKRFVTFLLMISVNVKTNNLRDTLLLIDEPDKSLHPTGARYLRDELIRISKKNYVVYSTHSIFMIDSGDIGRHYKVKKEHEITSIEPADASNITEEEVLYNAVGYSLFSILKENNILFEGWKDKRLFCIALENSSPDLKKKFKNVGVCHAKGVKSIQTITPMIELAGRDCIIISDSDKIAKEKQSTYKEEHGFGPWYTYQDLNKTIEANTGEDFIKNDFIEKHVRHVLTGKNMPVFDKAILPNRKGKLPAITKWLMDNGMSDVQTKDTVKLIKETIFEDIKPQNIEDAYTELMQSISFKKK